RYLALGGDDFDTRVGTVAAGVGLPADRLGVPALSLSGGQSARAGLAAILLARFDVFLLDEPTNDLDFAGLDLLEGVLKSLRGGFVVVSHDREFLDRVVDRMVEIEEHHHTAAEYAGGWSEYVERRALARSHQAQAYEAWAAQRARLRERIRTQRSWSEAGAARAKKIPGDHDKAQRDFFANRTEKQASKVRQSERALERLASVDKPWEGWELQLDLTPATRSGDVVARMEGAVVERGPFRLGPVDLEVAWADRVAITGPNGGGKSTLLAALLGRMPLSAGRRWLGPGVVAGELDQRRGRLRPAVVPPGRWGGPRGAALPPGVDLLSGFVAATGLLPEAARSMLAKFGLGAGDVRRTLAELSPGERTRAQLAVLMAAGTNCLVLDEPTNHLDLAAIEQLEAALARFEGTLLVVSHDRWLLATLDVSRAWVVEDGRVSERSG
ncbi:MAG: ABC-F family ATP-binding cassette domain-containing protein, partial [Acidimicrobiales bacterium]